jgi:TatD DNase family protein
VYIDTHAHLYLSDFKEDIEQVIEESQRAGVNKILLPNIDFTSIEALIELSNSYPQILYPMIGLHPCSVRSDFPVIIDKLQKQYSKAVFIAIGEIGIDLYWDKSFKNEQISAFKEQVEWANALQLPIVIHSRESLDLILDILEELNLPDLKGVFHCFTGDALQVERILSLNFYVGLGGVITFKKSNQLRQTVRSIPIGNILLETDAPYLTPDPFRSKRNESKYIPIIASQLSTILNMPVETVERITSENAGDLFSLH